MTCTYVVCGRAHMHIWGLRTCTYAICGLAHTRFAEVQLFPRGCHVATTWRTRCNHVATTWKQLHFSKSRMCKSANPRCACVHVRKSSMCKSANPRCASVHVMTAATYRATVGDTGTPNQPKCNFPKRTCGSQHSTCNTHGTVRLYTMHI